MGVLKEVMLTALIGLSPIWIAMVIGAICWAARYFGEPTKQSRYETKRNRPARANGGVRHG